MPKAYPPLSPDEVIEILTALGFSHKRTTGSHAHYERPASASCERAIVTVDLAEKEFDRSLMQSMIRQSKVPRQRFYGATKPSAKKASVPYLGRERSAAERIVSTTSPSGKDHATVTVPHIRRCVAPLQPCARPASTGLQMPAPPTTTGERRASRYPSRRAGLFR